MPGFKNNKKRHRRGPKRACTRYSLHIPAVEQSLRTQNHPGVPPRLFQAALELPPAPSLGHPTAAVLPCALPVPHGSPPSPVTRSSARPLVHTLGSLSAQLRLAQCPAPAAPPFYTRPEPSRRPRLPRTALPNHRVDPALLPASDWSELCVTRAGRGRCAPAGPAFSNLHALSPRPPKPRGGRGFPPALANQILRLLQRHEKGAWRGGAGGCFGQSPHGAPGLH